MRFFNCAVLVLIPISAILINICFVQAYAQLADTMLCADEACSEVISQGEARLAYRPRDSTFLHLKKGDLVLVKSKNAGKKSHLWGGEVMGSDQFGFFPSAFIKEFMVLVTHPSKSVSVQDFLEKRRSLIPGEDADKSLSPDQVTETEQEKNKDDKNKDNLDKSAQTDITMEKFALNEMESPSYDKQTTSISTKEEDGRESSSVSQSAELEQGQKDFIRKDDKDNFDEVKDTKNKDLDGLDPEKDVKPGNDQEAQSMEEDSNQNKEADVADPTLAVKHKKKEEEKGTTLDHASSYPDEDKSQILHESTGTLSGKEDYEKNAGNDPPEEKHVEEMVAIEEDDSMKTGMPPDIAALLGETATSRGLKKDDPEPPSVNAEPITEAHEYETRQKDDMDAGSDAANEESSDDKAEDDSGSFQDSHVMYENQEQEIKDSPDPVQDDLLQMEKNKHDLQHESGKEVEDRNPRNQEELKAEQEGETQDAPSKKDSTKLEDDERRIDQEVIPKDKEFDGQTSNNDSEEDSTEFKSDEERQFMDGDESEQKLIFKDKDGESDKLSHNHDIKDDSVKFEADEKNQAYKNAVVESEKDLTPKNEMNHAEESTKLTSKDDSNGASDDVHAIQKSNTTDDSNADMREGQVEDMNEDVDSIDENNQNSQGKTTGGTEPEKSVSKDDQIDYLEATRGNGRVSVKEVVDNEIIQEQNKEQKQQQVKENIHDPGEGKSVQLADTGVTGKDEEASDEEDQGEEKDDVDTVKDQRIKLSADEANEDASKEDLSTSKFSQNATEVHGTEGRVSAENAFTITNGAKKQPVEEINETRDSVIAENNPEVVDDPKQLEQAEKSNATPHEVAERNGQTDQHFSHDVVQKKATSGSTDDAKTQREAEEEHSLKEHSTDKSVLQVANHETKSKGEPDTDGHKSQENSKPNVFNTLHEGKVVSWDETIESEKERQKDVGWDETLSERDEGVKEPHLQKEDDIDPPKEEEKVDTELEEGNTTKPPASEDVPDQTVIESTVVPHVHHGEDTSMTQPVTDQPPTPEQPKEPQTESHPEKVDEGSLKDGDTNTSTTTVSEEVKAPDQETQHMEMPAVSTDSRDDIPGSDIDEGGYQEVDGAVDAELHVESLPLRLMIVLSRFPFDVIYVLEPFFTVWLSLLPEEYQQDVHGVSWTIVLSTLFLGFITIWLLICRSRASSRKRRDEHAIATIQELKTQINDITQEKLEKENELKAKQNELDSQRDEVANVAQENFNIVAEKTNLEHSLREYSNQNEAFKRDVQLLNQELREKEKGMEEVLTKSQQMEESLTSQREVISQYKTTTGQLQNLVRENEDEKRKMESAIEKFKERIKNLEKAKGETKKEGKSWKEQAEKLTNKIAELEDSLKAEREGAELKKQEVDVLKDCILQFKGVQEYLTDEGEDPESEEMIEKQKEKMKSMVDVNNVKATLRQAEAEKLHITYELEAEKKSRIETEGKVSELEATIQGNEAMKNKLERDKQMLESKLTVMQEFYAKREVEIQSKLGLEQSKRESNASLLEEHQQQQLELIQQLETYKKMGEDAKRQYEEAERQHKQEILGFEKKSHENWLASRDAERKLDEANKQVNQLHVELTDMQRRLRDSQDREQIIRPRPERHGPPGAPPPFGPPRRGPPFGVPGSPVHFRNGPPPNVMEGRSPPPLHRRPPSPGNSIGEERPTSRPDRPPSRPDRPPSAHSLPPMERRAPPGSGPYRGPPSQGPPGRGFDPYRDNMPPQRLPPPRPYPPQPRPPPGARMRGPITSSPYMERPPITSSQSPGPRSQNSTQSSLHAPPPQMTGDSLRNEGLQHPPPSAASSSDPPPPTISQGPGGSNPFRRAR